MWSLETEVSARGSADSRGTRCAVLKASMISPLPSEAYDPVAARPSAQRLAMRSHCRALSGASVARTTMHEPSRFSSGMRSVISRPTGTPSMFRRWRTPKLVSASTPTVQSRPWAETTRDEVPMPDLKSKHDMPVPAPTQPSATGPADGAVQRGPDVLFAHVHAAQVVEEPVVALADDGHDGVLDAGQRLALDEPAHGGVVDGAGALRVGEQDRRLDEAPLAHGADADELADAVGGVRAGDDALVPEVAAVREDRGDARAGGPAAVSAARARPTRRCSGRRARRARR